MDGERVNLMVLQAILEHDGHRVLTADNGQEAVERFQAESPDVVLMDVMMPVMDGYEATRRIKAGCGERFVPVIFLTALTDEHALALCIEAGGDDFLTKPYNRVIRVPDRRAHAHPRSARRPATATPRYPPPQPPAPGT